jgi:group I intron endonuclease
MGVIYKLTSPTGRVYIGRTKNFEKRMGEHKNLSESASSNYKIHQAIRKYGWDNFQKEILCEVSHKQAPIVEEQFIKAYNSFTDGYNSSESGYGGGDTYGDDIDKINNMKSILKEKMTGNGNPMYGKSHSEEAKQKQREKAKGRFSLEWFIDRNGKEEGTRLYEERRTWLKNRNLKKDSKGRFIKGS